MLDLRRKRDLGRILDDAFSLYGLRWRVFVLVGTAIAAPVDLIVLGVGLGWLWKGWDGTEAGAEVASVALAHFVVSIMLTALTVQVVLQEAEGRRQRLGAALRGALEAFAPLFVPMLLVAAGLVAGAIVLVFPALLVAIFLAVVPQAVIVERLRGAVALRRSVEIVSGRGWWVLGVQVTIGLILAVGLFAMNAGAEALGEAADARVVSVAGAVVAQVVAIPLLTLVTTLLYFSLRVAKGDDAGIPGATGWDRRLAEGWQPPV